MQANDTKADKTSYLCLQMFRSIFFFAVWSMALLQMQAKSDGKVIVVADMETRRPIRDVLVYLENGSFRSTSGTIRGESYLYRK